MKKIFYILLVLPLLVGCKDKKTKKTTVDIPGINVSKAVVEDVTLTKDYPGYLTTEQTVNLVARVNGTLESMSYIPGSRVKKGQLLFVIEPTIYRNEVAQAEATLATSQAELEYSRNNYIRMVEALKSDAVSQIQVIQAKSNAKQDSASVGNAIAALNTANTNLNYCYIHAPFDGVVTKNTVDVGSYISGATEATTLATIYKDDQMYAYFNVADNQWIAMMTNNKEGIPSEIMVKLGTNGLQTYPAKLDYFSPDVDMSTGALTLRASFDNPDKLLKSGMYVSITLPYAKQKNAILARPASMGTDQLGKYLYVITDSNTVAYRHIEVGQQINDSLQIVTKGLSPNERYVKTGLMKVRDGMKIKPIND